MTPTAFIADPALDKVLTNIARGNDDLLQHLRLHLLERAAADPKFSRQQIGYWIRTAQWEAHHYWEKATTYNRYVSEPTQILNADGADTYNSYLSEDLTDEATVFDELPGNFPTPEDEVERLQTLEALQDAIEQLTPKQMTVARLLAQGYSPSEIADRTGLSRASVSNLTRNMLDALREHLSTLA